MAVSAASVVRPRFKRCTNPQGSQGCIELFSSVGLATPFPDRSGMASCSATLRSGSFCKARHHRALLYFFSHFSSRRASLLRWRSEGFSSTAVPEDSPNLEHHGQSRPTMPRNNMKGPRLGPGPFPVREWLTAYSHGDINRHQELDDWRKGDDGWIKPAPKP